MKQKVMVVDDEKNIVDILAFNLKKNGYEVITASDGMEALEKVFIEKPDLVLLDVMMPRLDGFEVCKRIRTQMEIPILMLTARAEEVDKVLGLELGADDYITKPFSVRELLARVKANLRRIEIDDNKKEEKEKDTSLLVLGDLQINLEKYECQVKGQIVDLTLREFELIKFLAAQKGQIFSREALLEKVWGYEYYGDVRTVDVTIRRLREKIEPDPSKPIYIMTKRGVGYYFNG